MIEKTLKENISSLGIGITSLCNLNCPHCYSRGLAQKSMPLSEVKKTIKQFPNLKKVNLGTGESFLNKDFLQIVDFLESKNIEIALTTNGYTICNISDEYIKKFKDIDVSLDFPKKELHDAWRGTEGTFDMAIKSIEKCRKFNVNVSIAMALMNNNYKFLPGFKNLIKKYNIPLRVNLYKPVDTKKFLLNYEEFWEAVKLMSDNFKLISNSEPVLTLITGDTMEGSPCGKSARLHPDGSLTPCVYLNAKKHAFDEFMKIKNNIPKECSKCYNAKNCRGGCLGRRLTTYNNQHPDQYCPILNGKPVPEIKFERAEGENDFIHSGYLCTIILK